jgi:tight adherence protein C
MLILLLLGLMLTGAAFALTARALAFGGVRRQETFAQITTYGFSARVLAQETRERSGLRAVGNRLAAAVGGPVLGILDERRERELRTVLRSAGLYKTAPATFVGYRVLAGVLLPTWLLLMNAASLGIRTVGLALFAGAMGWVLPSFGVKRRASRRVEAIDLEMPELVDLLVTTVEAGVGLAASLQMVARRIEGPLGQELRLTLQEQNMGLTIEDSLQNMLGRVDSMSVRTFVQAIVQGQMLGVSIGKIMRDLALDMRKRRRQMAEERAQKAPTKILFPLVFLILPALMIIVLGGPVMGLGRALSGNL